MKSTKNPWADPHSAPGEPEMAGIQGQRLPGGLSNAPSRKQPGTERELQHGDLQGGRFQAPFRQTGPIGVDHCGKALEIEGFADFRSEGQAAQEES